MSDQPELFPISVDQPLATVPANTAWRDWVGIVASVGCAIHCAAMPFVISLLPAFGLSFLADESFHKWMALACFVIALVAFIPGWRKHRRVLPAVIALVGITVITSAAFGMTGDCCAACDASVVAASPIEACCEHCISDTAQSQPNSSPSTSNASVLSIPAWLVPWVTPLGGLFLVCGHLLNRRYGCLCGCCNVEKVAAE